MRLKYRVNDIRIRSVSPIYTQAEDLLDTLSSVSMTNLRQIATFPQVQSFSKHLNALMARVGEAGQLEFNYITSTEMESNWCMQLKRTKGVMANGTLTRTSEPVPERVANVSLIQIYDH